MASPSESEDDPGLLGEGKRFRGHSLDGYPSNFGSSLGDPFYLVFNKKAGFNSNPAFGVNASKV
jgi:hypothetical protein